MGVPKSYYVYEFSYPEGMSDLAGVVFYVGKGTKGSRIDDHFYEASNGCTCEKCQSIRSIWKSGLVVIRRIVFETLNESEALEEEKRRITQYQSPYLTNIQNSPIGVEKKREKNKQEIDEGAIEEINYPSMGVGEQDIIINIPFDGQMVPFNLTQWYAFKRQNLGGREYRMTSVSITPANSEHPPSIKVEGIYLPSKVAET